MHLEVAWVASQQPILPRFPGCSALGLGSHALGPRSACSSHKFVPAWKAKNINGWGGLAQEMERLKALFRSLDEEELGKWRDGLP